MFDKLKQFENRQPHIVFNWKDSETEAEGWVVINSLRGGAAGGGTRMRKGLDMREVLSLAKTMEVKFTVAGPPIGGAKSGINFNPADPRKEGVLKRWYADVLPLLKSYYGTGGDLNVDEIKEVLPITQAMGLEHCQEGVFVGHFKPNSEQKARIIRQLQEGVSKPVYNPRYTPTPVGSLLVADLITGWGVAEAVRHYYEIWGIPYAGKRVLVQGFGNVAGPAAWYLAKMGFSVTGIIDRVGGVYNASGYSADEIAAMLARRDGNAMNEANMIPYDQFQAEVWNKGFEVFIPAARSRVITKDQVSAMAANGLEVISSGANVPFDDPDIFLGNTGVFADERCASLPDFIANCGMARAFAYFMQPGCSMEDEAIFADISETIRKGLADIHAKSSSRTHLWQTGLGIAMDKLL